MGTPRIPAPRRKRPVVTYEPKGYDVKQIFQRVKSENLFENLLMDPRYVPWMYVSNVIQRALARVVGQGPFGPVPIKCNEEGSLHVAGLGGAYTRNETKNGSAADAYGAAIAFSAVMGRLDIYCLDNKMYFKRTRDDVIWDDEIELFKDSFYSIDCNTLKFNVKNYAAGLTARFQVVGWF